jgi:citrate synthase
MFTVIFPIARLPGWIANWKEMVENPAARLFRPRQVYQGKTERNYLPLPNR